MRINFKWWQSARDGRFASKHGDPNEVMARSKTVVKLNPWMEKGIELLAKYQRAHTDREDVVTLFDIKQEMVEHMRKCE